MRRGRRALGAALLGATLQVAAVTARVVVCRAPSGHVEIESALDGDCCPPSGAPRDMPMIRADEACEGCVDTPVVHAGLSTSPKSLLAVVPPAAWRSTARPRSYRPVPAVVSVAGTSSYPRRSVVLLI